MRALAGALRAKRTVAHSGLFAHSLVASPIGALALCRTIVDVFALGTPHRTVVGARCETLPTSPQGTPCRNGGSEGGSWGSLLNFADEFLVFRRWFV